MQVIIVVCRNFKLHMAKIAVASTALRAAAFPLRRQILHHSHTILRVQQIATRPTVYNPSALGRGETMPEVKGPCLGKREKMVYLHRQSQSMQSCALS